MQPGFPDRVELEPLGSHCVSEQNLEFAEAVSGRCLLPRLGEVSSNGRALRGVSASGTTAFDASHGVTLRA